MPFDLSLSALNIAVERAGRMLFKELSFKIASGEIMLVTGPNGSGKSSLLRAISGLLPLTEGRFHCELAGRSNKPISEMAHFIGHSSAIKGQLTARENLEFCGAMLASLGNLPNDFNILGTLTEFGLSHLKEIPAFYYSAGQKRRLALARLVVAKRPIWLLDEPVTALDKSSRSIVKSLMARHLAEGGLIIAASHEDLGLVPTNTLQLGQAR